MPIRVVVADDQELVRSGFSMILDAQDDIEVVGEAGNGAEAVAAVEGLRPDVLLLDVRMPVMDGIEAARLVTAGSDCRVLILTTFDLDEYVYDALQAGASGFLLKDVRRDDLVHAVRVVAAGDSLLAPSVTRRLIADFTAARAAQSSAALPPTSEPAPAGPVPVPSAALDVLTPRERETLALIARGLSNAEIAAELVLSEHTVKTHVSNILMKLGLRDRIHAVIRAYEAGLVGTTPPSSEG